MTEQNAQQQMDKMLFSNLAAMLGSSALQQMGKLVNPITQKAEVNLEGAQLTIDMLSMLKTKTAGNLDSEEDKMISDLIAQLQMNYVETARSQPEQKDDSGEEESEAGKEAEENPEPAEDTPDEKKDPKFHKSYGEK